LSHEAETVINTTHPEWWSDLDRNPVDTIRLPARQVLPILGKLENTVARRAVLGELLGNMGINQVGARAEGSVLFERSGFRPDRVVTAAHTALERAGQVHRTITGTGASGNPAPAGSSPDRGGYAPAVRATARANEARRPTP
jgi:hypothetical protein